MLKKALWRVGAVWILLFFAAIIALAIVSGKMGMIFLSNTWCDWFWATFSTVITLVMLKIPGVAIIALKALAIMDPNIPSNAMVDFIQKYRPQKEVMALQVKRPNTL